MLIRESIVIVVVIPPRYIAYKTFSSINLTSMAHRTSGHWKCRNLSGAEIGIFQDNLLVSRPGCFCCCTICGHVPLARYVQLLVSHAPGMPGTFSPPLRVSDPDMHHGMSVTHVPCFMPGSLTSGFLWSRRRGKRSRHSRCMRNPQFYVSGRGPWQWIYRIHESLSPRNKDYS